MFWRNVRLKRWTIVFHSVILRLTLLYTFSIMLILLIVSGVLYVSLKENLHRNESQFLYSESQFLNKINAEKKLSLIYYLHHEKDKTLEDYWETLLYTSSFGILAAAIAGLSLAYRSMRPVRNITNAMQKTTVSQLECRLNTEKNWPTEFTHLANHFNAMLDRLDTSFKHLSQFSADLAHELRTPINNLKGEAEICLMKLRSAAEYQQVIGSSLEEYERLSRIIESLLFLARAEVPQNQISYKKIPLRKTIQAIIDFYMPIAEEKSITLECYGDENNQVILSADELLFQRVIHNLCSNALRYTSTGGSVFVQISTSQNKIILQIIDTGIGIATEHLPHLFERFYRTDSARAQESGGNGLGLAIVKSIMDLHHAQISVDSIEGKGTTVTLIFNKF